MPITDFKYSVDEDRLEGILADSLQLGSVGGHKILQATNDSRTYLCLDCRFEYSYNMGRTTPEQRRLIEAYVFGDALETDCEDDRDLDIDVEHTKDRMFVNIDLNPRTVLRKIKTTLTVDQNA